MGIADQVKKATLRKAYGYFEKNPEENAVKLLNWVDKLAGEGPDSFQPQRDAIRKVLEDPNNNMLRPCPMLENPDKLRKIVAETGAHSTDLQSPESAEHLCAKCDAYAKNWVDTADRLWECSCRRKAEKKQ